MPQGGCEKEPLRVLFIQGVSRYGGALRSLLNTARLLKEARHHPVVVTSREGRLSRECRQHSIPCYTFPIGMWRKVKSWPFIPLVLYRLLRVVKTEGVNLVCCNTLWDAPYGLLAGRVAGLPVAVFLRNQHSRELLDKYHVGMADAVFGVSFCCLRRLSPSQRRRAFVIYNALEEMGSCPRLGDGLTLSIVGRVDTTKGQVEFVEQVFRRLLKRVNILLYVVGGASAKERWLEEVMRGYEGELGDAFVFTGPVEDVRPYYGADVVVIPSKREAFEGLPRVAIEAASLARFVAATDSGGTRELVFEKTGALVGDVSCLADVIEGALFLPAFRKKAGLNAGRKVFAMCSRDVHLKALLGRFGGLLC